MTIFQDIANIIRPEKKTEKEVPATQVQQQYQTPAPPPLIPPGIFPPNPFFPKPKPSGGEIGRAHV